MCREVWSAFRRRPRGTPLLFDLHPTGRPGPMLASSEAMVLGGVAEPIAFFTGWVLIGLAAAAYLVRKGHDPGLTLLLGAGLGPILVPLIWDLRDRDRERAPLVLEPGVVRSGSVDVLVWVPGSGADIAEVVPSLRGVAAETRSLTIARVVPYEWLEEGPDEPTIRAVTRELRRARNVARTPDAALVAFPGRMDEATSTFVANATTSLVLYAQASVRAQPQG